MDLFKFKNNVLKQKGFTLFYAVLVAAALGAIGAAIFRIALKELVLSSTMRDSQYAFYAADSGAECALFWDLKRNAFDPNSTDPTRIDCNGQSFNMPAGNQFLIENIVYNPEGYCAKVLVTKSDVGAGQFETRIESRGYNTCNTSNPRRVERGIVITY